MILQGLPPIITPSGTDLVTTDLAATITFDSMVTPGKIHEPDPIYTLSFIIIPPKNPYPEFRF